MASKGKEKTRGECGKDAAAERVDACAAGGEDTSADRGDNANDEGCIEAAAPAPYFDQGCGDGGACCDDGDGYGIRQGLREQEKIGAKAKGKPANQRPASPARGDHRAGAIYHHPQEHQHQHSQSETGGNQGQCRPCFKQRLGGGKATGPCKHGGHAECVSGQRLADTADRNRSRGVGACRRHATPLLQG